MDEWKKPDIGRHNLLGIVVCIVLVLFGWAWYDSHRNDGLHQDTDATMDRIEERIQSVEQRIDRLSARLENAQKTIADLGGRIESSENLAKEIGTGIDGVEKRVDSAIQRCGRIKNLIDDIERQNK